MTSINRTRSVSKTHKPDAFRTAILLTLFVSCAIVSCNPMPTDTSSDENPTQTNAVSIVNHAFSPQVITVTVGTTVTWTNNDGIIPHSVISTDASGELGSATLGNGETYSHTFSSAGTFTYKCGVHASMTGKVIVTN